LLIISNSAQLTECYRIVLRLSVQIVKERVGFQQISADRQGWAVSGGVAVLPVFLQIIREEYA